MKYWRENYLTKHKIKYFGGIIIGDVDKIILYVLICSLEHAPVAQVAYYIWKPKHLSGLYPSFL